MAVPQWSAQRGRHAGEQHDRSCDKQGECGDPGDQPGASPEAADSRACRFRAAERPQGLGKAGGICESVDRIRSQRFRHNGAQGAGQHTVRRPGRLLAGPDTGEQLLQHHAQRKDVAAQIDRFAAQ